MKNWLLDKIIKLFVLHDKVIDLLPNHKFLRKKVVMIKPRNCDDDRVYLERYIIFKFDFCSLYLHRFLMSDESDLHNHPWEFRLLHLKGEYTELMYDGLRNVRDNYYTYDSINVVRRRAWDYNVRHRGSTHMIQLDKDYNNDIENAPMSICLTFNRKYENGEAHWGFYENVSSDLPAKYLKLKYVPHNEYLAKKRA